MSTPADPRAPELTAVDYDPFGTDALARVVPSTEAQREIWLAAKLGEDASLAYNESVALRFRGKLDGVAMRAALQDLLDRHDALRATFGPDGETFCVPDQLALTLAETDLTTLAPAARDTALERASGDTVQTPFDLEHGPLFRAELVRFAADDHALLLAAHHIVCDGWSWWVIVSELSTLYSQRTGASCGVLPAVDSFADYALAQASQPDRRALAADESYWLARYAVPAPVLDLPRDRARPPRRGFASAREDYTFDAALVTALKSLGARHGASLFATLIGSFATVLARLAGQHDVVVGIPAAAQALDGHDHLVGHGVNLLPLRCALDPAVPFSQLLRQARTTLLDALDHQRCTFGTLLKKLDIARDPSRPALVSVLFNIDQALDHEATTFTGLAMEFSSTPRRFENFELFVNAVQEHGQLRLECQYNTQLFDAATVRRWLSAYETLLRAAVAQPETALGELPLLDARACAELVALQPPATAPGSERCVHTLFETQCDRAPTRIALRFGSEVLSYAELDARANRIAHGLRTYGVRGGALVGIALDRGPAMLAAVLGVLKAGAGYVPLDPGFPAERLSYMVSDAGLAALLTHSDHAARFDLRGRPVLSLDQLEAEWRKLPATRLEHEADDAAATSASTAYVIYTSGSTGQPKGVEIPHRAAVNFLASMVERPGLHADDRLLAVTTLSFDIAVLELFGPLCVGGEVVLARREEAMDGEALNALLTRSRATLMQATPATWRMLLQAQWSGSPTFRALCGGEALAPDLAAALLARCGEVWNLYGPTETTVWSTCWRVESPEQGIAIGTPIANTSVWILDEQRQLCPIGVPGEIWIGGAGVASGYLNRPELTTERFIPDPYSNHPDARLYRTGDRGRWQANGTLEHLGRIDFQVKLRGFRIELGEIEAHLLSRAEVAHAVAVVREDRPGDARLVAYVVAQPNAVADESALRAHLRDHLPDYMIPQHIVILAAFPQTPNGKIDRARLPAPLASTSNVATRRAPLDELELTVASAMNAALGGGSLSADDNFFEHGGHSLLAAQLTARLNRDLKLSLPLRTIFEAPTVARLAAAIRASDTATAAPQRSIPRLADRQRAPLSLQQQRLWYVEQLHPGRVVYHTPSAHRLRGPMNEAAFERALQEMVRRQPVLRTSIETAESTAVQLIHDDVEVRLLPLEDLSTLPVTEREKHLHERLEALTAEPFDLAVAPLFRTHLFRVGEHEHVFFFMTHHIIWDGWSFDLMYQELSALYAVACAGQPFALAPLAIEYADFAAWQREWMQGDELAGQVAHWMDRLGGKLEPLILPADRPRPARMSGAGATEWIRLPAESAQAIHALGQHAAATPFMVLLTVYYVLLHRLGGQRDVIVGTPVRGRDRVELESVMGFFVNALPLRLTIDPQASFLQTLQAVRDVVIDAFAFPDVPIEHLIRALKLPRDESRPPLYQTMFSYQDVRQRSTVWADLQHDHLPLFQHGTADDLGVWFIEQPNGLLGGLVYNTDLFDAATAVRFSQCYEALLASALVDPQQSVAQLTVLPATEQALLQSWNATDTQIMDQTVHTLFEAQCDRAPARIALRFGSEVLSYAELDARANRIAHGLRTYGVRSGALVGIALDRGPAMLAAVLGVLKAGAGYVPLDPGFPAERLSYMVSDAGLAALLSHSDHAARFDLRGRPVLSLDQLEAEWRKLPATRLERDVDDAAATPASTAYVIYTSGSTGQPKGVEIPHRAVVNFLASMVERPGLHEDDRLLAVTTLSFDIAVLELFGPLCVGGEVVLARREEAMDGEALNALLTRSRATLMQATPATWRMLLQAQWSGSPTFRALCGGEALAPDLAAALLARCGEVWNLYGPTETTIWSTCWRVESPEQGIAIGTPIANTCVWILDEQRQLCPIGVPGEIWIGGAGVASGYLNRPELTTERFIPDPYSNHPDARLYRTGDRGRWQANGTLEHLGRIDFQVKLRGFRIELGEIEAVARAEPVLSECVAKIHEINELDRRLVLYVAADEPAETLLPRLRARLEAQLPVYMRPQHIVVLTGLPQTPNGKIDRNALPAPVLSAQSDSGADEPLANADPRQRYLGELWRDLIGQVAVSPDDNFFDIGGHSLLAVEMAARVRKETGARLNLLDIATGTLASLAMGLPETTGAAEPAGGSLARRLRHMLGFGS